jgi:hypothetical protein
MRLHLDEGASMPPADQTALVPAAPLPAPRPAVAFGITPQELDTAWRYAQMLAGSDMVPKAYQNKPENVMVAMGYGAEVGLRPMAALQSVAVINGKPGLYGDGFLAVIMATPAYVNHKEFYLVGGQERDELAAADLTKDDTTAVTHFWRRGRAEPFIGTFSIANAKKARLLNKEGPWTDYPARMLRWRAREFAGRDGFAPELRGMSMVEALRDAEVIDAEPPRTIAAPVRRSLAAVDPPVAPPTPPAAAAPPPPVTAAPTPAPVPAAPATAARGTTTRPASTTTPTTTTTRAIIEETSLIQESGGLLYEVKAMEVGGDERFPPIGHVFLTPDEALYKLAASCEGSGALLLATWHRGTRTSGAVAKFLDSLIAED